MTDETKGDPIDRMRALLLELFPPQPPPDPAEQAAAEDRADARTKQALTATDARFEREIAFREKAANAAGRENTAATILAALVDVQNATAARSRWDGDRAIFEQVGSVDMRLVGYTVALADALRAELAKVKP